MFYLDVKSFSILTARVVFSPATWNASGVYSQVGDMTIKTESLMCGLVLCFFFHAPARCSNLFFRVVVVVVVVVAVYLSATY